MAIKIKTDTAPDERKKSTAARKADVQSVENGIPDEANLEYTRERGTAVAIGLQSRSVEGSSAPPVDTPSLDSWVYVPAKATPEMDRASTWEKKLAVAPKYEGPEVHKGVHLPRVNVAYPFAKMEVNDMFEVKASERQRVASAAHNYGKKNGRKYSIKQRENKLMIGVWRVK